MSLSPSLPLSRSRPIRRLCHPYARKSASQAVISIIGCSSPFMGLTQHLAFHFTLAVSAWSVTIRRAPSRRCRGARVHGHTTTAMHDDEYTPPPSLYVYVSYFVFIYDVFVILYLFVPKCTHRASFVFSRNIQTPCISVRVVCMFGFVFICLVPVYIQPQAQAYIPLARKYKESVYSY